MRSSRVHWQCPTTEQVFAPAPPSTAPGTAPGTADCEVPFTARAGPPLHPPCSFEIAPLPPQANPPATLPLVSLAPCDWATPAFSAGNKGARGGEGASPCFPPPQHGPHLRRDTERQAVPKRQRRSKKNRNEEL
ncbi:hypothetical protein MATL_G00258610 [Megalops atlanticus]|uniref:Uncharacterized protein n=1 Tax=Megalops atlanticus TaxID=7932 RepID=A0A9D3STX6_MEGAT|nr:hypothetical protein MATL_G00258610 [Megalops atlanticus]